MNALRGIFAALLALAAATVAAQSWPAKPVRIVAPYAAGGSNDIAARILAERLSQRLGQQTLVAKSAPDGYTLFFCAAPHSTNPGLYPKLPYDTVRDFAPVAHAVSVPIFLLASLGMTPVGGTPEQFGTFIRADIDKWTKLIHERGIKPD